MKKSQLFILVLSILAFVSCVSCQRDSERIKDAFEQAQLVYGEGENDTLLFIPELDKASSYFVRKKDYGKAALSALYYGYSEMNYDRITAMNAFMNAEQYGDLVHDSLTVARAQYQIGRMQFYDGRTEEALTILKKADSNFDKCFKGKALNLNALACCHILLQEYEKAELCLKEGLLYAQKSNSDETIQKITSVH